MQPESNEDIEEFEDEEFELDIEENDYGFIFDEEGTLKSIFLPKNPPFAPPEIIAKLLEVLEIYDIDDLDNSKPLH